MHKSDNLTFRCKYCRRKSALIGQCQGYISFNSLSSNYYVQQIFPFKEQTYETKDRQLKGRNNTVFRFSETVDHENNNFYIYPSFSPPK